MTQIITTSSTTFGTNITAAIVNQYIYIAEGVTRGSENALGLASTFSGVRAVVLGNVTGLSTGASLINTTGDFGNFDVVIGASGSIAGGSIGLLLRDSGNSITNHGFIWGGITGVFSTGDNLQLSNTGTISGGSGFGVNSSGVGSDIVNYGLIETASGNAVEIFDGEDTEVVTLTNYGTITNAIFGGRAVFADITEADEIRNFGTINGFVDQRNGDDFHLNTGTINGDVLMGADEDRVENSGDIFGDVVLGDGVDVYRGDGDSTVSGGIYGGLGEDRMFGGQNADIMYGEDDADKMRGRAGDDELYGGAGEDDMRGNDGDDLIFGNQDNDVITGGRGDDEIFGGSGEDKITGGSGDDILSGNSGDDTFVFALKSGIDEITDFTNNNDALDLSAFNLSVRQDLTDAGAIIADGAGSIIDLRLLGGDGVIYVEDMTVNQWGNSDFVF